MPEALVKSSSSESESDSESGVSSESESDEGDTQVGSEVRNSPPPVKKPRLDSNAGDARGVTTSSSVRARQSTSSTNTSPARSRVTVSRATMPPPPIPSRTTRAACIVPEDFRIPNGAEVITIKDEEDDGDFDFHITEEDAAASAPPRNARQLADDMDSSVVNGKVTLEELKL